MNIVITGTSQGIGLELTSQALAQGHRVLAVARNPQASRGLQELKLKWNAQLDLAAVELQEPHAPEKILSALSSWPSVDVLINNAGIYPEGETLDHFLKGFQINSVVPFLLTRALFPKLRASENPKAIHITSLMGSIADNESGGSYAYRASKAALNMISKTLAQDEDWLTSVVIHPGWVQTRMGGAEAPTQVAASAQGIWKVIHHVDRSESGSFFDFEGDRLPW